jgi:ABC-type Mn2+/Zn2+ transport system permease subunit
VAGDRGEITARVTLVAATLVIPAVVARMLTDSFSRMLR